MRCGTFKFSQTLILLFTLSFSSPIAASDICKKSFGVLSWRSKVQEHLPNMLGRFFLPQTVADLPSKKVSDLSLEQSQAVARAVSAIEADPASVMAHIKGIFADGSTQLAGGLHDVNVRTDRLRDQVLASAPSDKQTSDYIDHIRHTPARVRYMSGATDPEIARQIRDDVARRFKVLGLSDERPLDRLIFELISHQSVGKPTYESNGVVKFQFKREFFNSKAWKLYKMVARNGRGPMGAKTFFPVEWDEKKIQSSILGVIKNRKSKVLSANHTNSGPPMMTIEGNFEGVQITVSLVGDKIVSAYPSWNQNPNESIGSLYARRREALDDLERHLEDAALFSETPVHLYPEDAIEIYLGGDLSSVSPRALAFFEPLLSPVGFQGGRIVGNNGGGAYFGRSLIESTTEFLETDALIRRYEAVAWIEPPVQPYLGPRSLGYRVPFLSTPVEP